MKILINRSDNLGDIIYTLPLASMIKRHLSGVSVYFLTRPYAETLPHMHADVDDVITTDQFFANKPDFPQFDVYINAYSSGRCAKQAKQWKIPLRIGSARRISSWRYCNRWVNVKRKGSQCHEVMLNALLLRPLLSITDVTTAELMEMTKIRATQTAFAEKTLSKTQHSVIIHPASNGNGREWPLEHVIELTYSLIEKSYQVILTGSSGEHELCERVRLSCPQAINASGKSSLAELLSLIQAADALVASGTGPLHIAAALGTPCVGLFPPLQSLDQKRWGPRLTSCINLQHPNCTRSSCYNDDCSCMMHIMPGQVLNSIEQLVKQHPSRRHNLPLDKRMESQTA